ncbi:MAG: beta-ketoacyl-[acyl-carrier-protein] synthase family protein [Rhodospirillaceae bacterium]|nr:beta-ketoacyl-[acyl-carrier-protein] synthase family protein [Rhodospirillaceae bacterium]
MNRVVITGMGCISAQGHTAQACWAAMKAGTSGIGPLVNIPTERLKVAIGAEVRNYDPEQYFDRKQSSLYDRVSQFAMVAAREAIAQAAISFDAAEGMRTAAILGSGIGGQTTIDEGYQRLYGDNVPRVHPLTIPRLMINAPASHLSIEYGITGPSFVVASACASANHAMAIAFDMVRRGQVDVAITGGTEAPMTLGVIKSWEALRVMSPDTCRPFTKDRRGMVLGEGAGIFVLETLDHARKRGVPIIAEIAGTGMSSDAKDIVQPSEDGAVRAMQLALDDARLSPDGIDYVNAHGTGTPANDVTETRAIRRIFGARADAIPVSSSKSMHGHALGAAGALELIAVLGALTDGIVPPTANFTTPDPECDLDYVPNTARRHTVCAALSNSFAFGGHNCVLALKRFE